MKSIKMGKFKSERESALAQKDGDLKIDLNIRAKGL